MPVPTTDIEAEAESVGITDWAPLAVISFADFENRKHELAKQLLEAARTAGFFYITDHGVPQDHVERLYGYTKKLYEENSVEVLNQYKSNGHIDGNYAGYVGPAPDKPFLAAFYNFAKPKSPLCRPNPPNMEEHLEDIDAFQAYPLEINDKLLRLLSLALELPEDHFSKIHNKDAPSGSHARLMYYPKRDPQEDQKDLNMRVTAHTDCGYGSITMMFSPPVVALQALDNSDQKTWRYVKPIEGALVCNIGDTMQFLTGGVLKSTQHRVTRPPLPSQQGQARLNVLYFTRADNDTPLIPPPSPLVPAEAHTAEGVGLTAGEWVANRVKATVKLQRATGGSLTVQDDESKNGYNQFQRLINKNQARTHLEDSYATSEVAPAAN